MKSMFTKSLISIAGCLLLAMPFAAQADDYRESGLAHPFHIALGAYSTTSSDSVTSTGTVVKMDYSFFRPARHEAVATLWLGHSSGDGGHDWFGPTAEYRWRFGGHGIAYYGIGGGYLASSGGGSSSSVLTAGLGVRLKNFSIESRSLVMSNEVASALMVGYHF